MSFLKQNWQAITIGCSATFIGIGLGRFAYTPLIPALISAGWFDASEAKLLGAANLLGYLFGAISAKRLSDRFGDEHIIRLSVALSALSFFLCARPEPFSWFFIWRLASGVTGGWLMVIGPSIALSQTPAEKRPIVGTLAFMGIGAGAILSALAVPSLMQEGLGVTWTALGAAVLLVGIAAMAAASNLEGLKTQESAAKQAPSVFQLQRPLAIAVLLVFIAYVGDAIGFVPHTVFWVDFLERDVGLSVESANFQWAIFGFGALCGPILTARLVTLLGWKVSLFSALLIKSLAVGLPYIAVGFFARSASSFIVGALVPGVVAITSGRIAELVGPEHHKAFWGKATALFAIGQAFSGYAMVEALEITSDYRSLFLISALILGFASTCALVSGGTRSSS